LYSAYKSKESLGASVAKKMCFQRSSERIEGESRPLKPGWKSFHSRGPAAEKLLSPSLLWVRGTSSCRGYLSGVKCKWSACGPANATVTHHLVSFKIQTGLNFLLWLTQDVLKKEA